MRFNMGMMCRVKLHRLQLLELPFGRRLLSHMAKAEQLIGSFTLDTATTKRNVTAKLCANAYSVRIDVQSVHTLVTQADAAMHEMQ